MCDVVCEEVVEGKIILGWIWEGVKLIFFGIFSKVFWNLIENIGIWCLIRLYVLF